MSSFLQTCSTSMQISSNDQNSYLKKKQLKTSLNVNEPSACLASCHFQLCVNWMKNFKSLAILTRDYYGHSVLITHNLIWSFTIRLTLQKKMFQYLEANRNFIWEGHMPQTILMNHLIILLIRFVLISYQFLNLNEC